MKYTVGQVIFLLLRKDKKVIPVKIVEQIVRRTLDEEVVSYNVVFPDKKSTVSPLGDLNAEVFTDVDDLRDKMIERATGMIDEIVGHSKKVACEKLDYLTRQETSPANGVIDEDAISSDTKEPPLPQSFSNAEVDLGGGLKARVSSSAI